MEEITPASGLARLVRALADVPHETREELVDALATLALAEPDELRALADGLAAGAPVPVEVTDPVAVARFSDGSSRAYATIGDLLPGGLNSLMGDMRIRYLVMLRSQREHAGSAFGLPDDARVEIVDQQRAVAELG